MTVTDPTLSEPRSADGAALDITLDDAVFEPVSDHPPAAKVVYLTLLADGPLTACEIHERTHLGGSSPSTVYNALETLEDAGLVEPRPSTTHLSADKFQIAE